MKEVKKFLPAGLIVAVAILLFGSVVLMLMATPVLFLRGGFSISIFGLTLYQCGKAGPSIVFLVLKGLLSIALFFSSLGLLYYREEARRVVSALLLTVGVFAPIVLSFDFHSIDAVFVTIMKAITIMVSLGILYYLFRPKSLEIFQEKGIAAEYSYTYCPICASRGHSRDSLRCPDCAGALLRRYDTDDGWVFADRVDGSELMEEGGA